MNMSGPEMFSISQDSDLEELEPLGPLEPVTYPGGTAPRFQHMLNTKRALIGTVIAVLALVALAMDTSFSEVVATAGLAGVVGLAEGGKKAGCRDAVVGDKCWEAARWAKMNGIRAHPDGYPGLTPQSSLFKFQASVHRSASGECPHAPCSGGIDDVAVPQTSLLVDVAQLEPQPRAAPAVKESVGQAVEMRYSVTDMECVSPLVPVTGTGPAGELTMTCGCPPPQLLDRRAGMPTCSDPTGPSQMTFYMYRAQSDDEYPPENVNAADLAGLMWYLHDEVVASVPRKFGITRVLRYKVTMQTTQELYSSYQRQFGPYAAFDAGKCMTPLCDSLWEQFGFVVGCQNLDRSAATYVRDYKESQLEPAEAEMVLRRLRGSGGMPPQMPADQAADNGFHTGIWYSLPGACPNSTVEDKTHQCMKSMPGGHCKVVNGTRHCTYNAEYAGEIRLDDLSGILDEERGIRTYEDWWKNSHLACLNAVARGEGVGPCVHHAEYDVLTDEGIGTSFWNGKHDMKQGLRRMARVRQLFRENYPHLPENFEEPPCL